MSVISERIAKSDDLAEILTDPIPEWDDVRLLLIAPTVQERADMMEQYTTWVEDVDGNRVPQLDTVAMGPSLLIHCSHDPETRERAFEPSDMAMLKGKNGAVVERVAKECLPLVGFAKEGATEAGKDDSSMTPSGATGSDSPVALAAP